MFVFSGMPSAIMKHRFIPFESEQLNRNRAVNDLKSRMARARQLRLTSNQVCMVFYIDFCEATRLYYSFSFLKSSWLAACQEPFHCNIGLAASNTISRFVRERRQAPSTSLYRVCTPSIKMGWTGGNKGTQWNGNTTHWNNNSSWKGNFGKEEETVGHTFRKSSCSNPLLALAMAVILNSKSGRIRTECQP